MNIIRNLLLTLLLIFGFCVSGQYSQVNGLENPWTLLDEVIALIASEKYDESLQKLKQVLENESNFADAYAVEGLVLYKQGKYNESLTPLETAINLYEDGNASFAQSYNRVYGSKGIPYYYYANSLFMLGRYNESADSYSSAIAAFENYANALNMQPHPISCHIFDGKSTCIIIYPDGDRGYMDRAFIYAINAAKSSNNASLSEVYYWKGNLLYELGRTDESMQYYNKAKAINESLTPYSRDD